MAIEIMARLGKCVDCYWLRAYKCAYSGVNDDGQCSEFMKRWVEIPEDWRATGWL